MIITGTVTGDQEVGLMLRSAPNSVKTALRQAVNKLTIILRDKIVEEKLQNQVLHVRGGHLQRSIHPRIISNDDVFIGMAWTNISYAARHEFGFHGPETVKAHMRKIKTAFGRPIAEKEIAVRSFTRDINYPARSFMRSALREMEPQIIETLTLATHEGIKH